MGGRNYKHNLKDRLRAAQGNACCYCGCRLTTIKGKPNSETFEHLQRRSEGGGRTLGNVALACYACNTGRGEMNWLLYASYKRGELMMAV